MRSSPSEQAARARPQPEADPRRIEVHWERALEGAAGERVRRVLSSLPLASLVRYPPPREGRFPFGRESSILARLMTGRSVQFHPSGLSRAYSALAPPRHRILYRAFTLGDALSRTEWESLLGADEVSFFEDQGLLVRHPEGIRAAFRVVVLAGLSFVVDAFASQARFRNRVHAGKDTLELLERLPACRGDRYLDVGTGSGALLLAAGRAYRESVGVDINGRAVAIARFNAELNGIRCSVLATDVFTTPSLGRFDLVTWNLPFHFLPAEEREHNVDGDGGEMGIELTLRFVDLLPSLLTNSGSAYLLTSSPTLVDGSEPLIRSLSDSTGRSGLDVTVTEIQALWSPSRRRFLRGHGIRRVDNVVLELRRGAGRFTRVRAPTVQRIVDAAQSLRYR